MTNLKSSLLILALLGSSLDTTAADWDLVEVPGPLQFTGYAWYRSWLKPHPSFFNNHERDLYGESVVFNIRGLAGAHEVFVNGKQIGSGGRFPPDFKDGRDGNHRHKVPSGTLVKDEWNEIAIRVFQPKEEGGFLSEPPFIMNYFQECVFEGAWEYALTEDPKIEGVALKTQPPQAAFDRFHDSNRVLGEAETLVHGKKLPPLESLSKINTADDLQADLLLHEPQIAQPTHLSFDEKGRLWVSQYRQYPYPAGLRMLSRDRFYRSHYDRTPPAPPNHDRGRDVISIHEDTNGDGKYDRHKVFQDGLNMANAAVRGWGGVWIMHTPYLLFYPDVDFDDIPDGPPVVHLQGFGLEDTHSIANGLVWGMDGWLYGAQGSTASCRVTRPGIDPPDAAGVSFVGCMVWRYHPRTRDFELFAEGGGNNFGLEVDAQGRVFTGHNGGQTRGWHYVQGGLYLMQGVSPGKFGPPHNPFAFGSLPMMKNEQPIKRFTHFAALVEGSAIPEKYHQHFFAVDPLHNFVIASRRKAEGSTFSMTDLEKVLTSDDFAFRPVHIVNAPDGSVLIADFYEHYIAHGQHYQSQIDPTTGRVFRLRGKRQALETDLNLAAKSTDELIKRLGHPNKWHRQTTVRLLGERGDERARSQLGQLIESGPDLTALNALWAYYQAFDLDDTVILKALQHSSAPIRYWGVRLACDTGDVPSKWFEAINDRARSETDAEVRSQMAGSARRLPVDQAFRLVKTLVTHDEDANDAYVPLMCWWVLEAHADDAPDDLLSLFANEDFWNHRIVYDHLLSRTMRRFAAKGRNQDLLACARLLDLAPTEGHIDKLLEGFNAAYQGRSAEGLPRELIDALTGFGLDSVGLRIRLGDAEAVSVGYERLMSPDATLSDRIEIARVLGDTKRPGAIPTLLEIAAGDFPLELRKAAIAALIAFEASEIGQSIAGVMNHLPEPIQPMAFDLLLSRAVWTQHLVDGLQAGTINRRLISGEILQRLSHHENESIRARIHQLALVQNHADNADWQTQISEIEAILKATPGNPYAGEELFMQRCASCHKLFFKGGNIGPDLTPYQRDNLDTMLISIINPNAEIREGYHYVSVTTKDARHLSGFMTDQDNQVVVLRGLGGEDFRLRRTEIDAIETMGRSLMPEGLLQGLDDRQLRDLFAYLRISQPITE